MATSRIGNQAPQGAAAAFIKSTDNAKASEKTAATAPVPTAPATTKAATKSAETVGVNISPKAKERADAQQKALEIARNTPDVREDRVKALKAQIDAGTYQIDSGKIADGMLREAIKEHLSETIER